MKLFDFLLDKIMIIVLNIACMFLLSFFLLFLQYSSNIIVIIDIVWFFILVVYMVSEYYRRNKYFKKLYKTLINLDKRYLISEVMESSYRLEDKKYREILRLSNKSVIEKINKLEDEQKDYKEYIEGWIHEVKLPITAIELICDNNKNEVTRKIKNELSKLDNYVEMALFYARSDEVYKDYLIKEINLKDTVYEAIARNKSYLINNSMQISVDNLDEVVYSDDKWIIFIINQILINCVKYSNKDRKEIKIYSEKIKDGIRLCIEDNGIGIKESEIDRVFNKGFTGSNGRNNRKSTGIGLYLCKKLCDKLGIYISIQSKLNEYTRVNIIFPKGDYLSKL